MLRSRIIPCLLLKNNTLHKTVRFKKPKYIGDPLNAIKIFNEKMIDELLVIDITATTENRGPNFEMIEQIASECFMPVCYGGGIKDAAAIKKIFNLGIEKISIGSRAIEDPDFVKAASGIFGSQSVAVCIDVKRNFWGKHEVVSHNARKKTGFDPVEFASKMEAQGAGELLINSVDRDGTMAGYDIALIKKITQNTGIPVVACGGAGKPDDLAEVIRDGGAASAAAGSLFVFYGPHRAVLINYPEDALFNSVVNPSIP